MQQQRDLAHPNPAITEVLATNDTRIHHIHISMGTDQL